MPNRKGKPISNKDRIIIAIDVITIIVAILSIIINYIFLSNSYNLDSQRAQYELPQNYILVGSSLQDNIIKNGQTVDGTITVTNNFPHFTISHIEFVGIYKITDYTNQKINSGYYVSDIKPDERIINSGDNTDFTFSAMIDNSGDYNLIFIIYYEYDQETGNYYTGQQKSFENKLFVE